MRRARRHDDVAANAGVDVGVAFAVVAPRARHHQEALVVPWSRSGDMRWRTEI